MYLYNMKQRTRKRFQTMFHVEQKTENTMSEIKPMNGMRVPEWTKEKVIECMAISILGKFIQSLKQ